jgi:hypothetical protein
VPVCASMEAPQTRADATARDFIDFGIFIDSPPAQRFTV